MRSTAILVLLACAASAAADADAQGRADVLDPDEFAFEAVEDEPAAAADEFAAPAPGDAQPQAAAAAAAAGAPQAAAATPEGPKDYTYEAVAGAFVVAFLAGFFVGKAKNRAIADAFVAAHSELIAEQFAVVGEAAGAPADLVAETYDSFRIYATGRRFCRGAFFDLKLRPRQSLYGRLLELAGPSQDRLVLSVPVQEMPPFVFAVARKRALKTLVQERMDLQNYAELQAAPAGLPFQVATDCPELVAKLLHGAVVKTLTKYADSFESLVFSDEAAPVAGQAAAFPRVLEFTLRLPADAAKMGDLRLLLEMALHYVDLVGRQVRLSQGAAKRAREARAAVAKKRDKEQQAERLEAAQRRKEERLAKERQEYEALSAEQKQRRDAKEDKRKARKQRDRFKGKMQRV